MRLPQNRFVTLFDHCALVSCSKPLIDQNPLYIKNSFVWEVVLILHKKSECMSFAHFAQAKNGYQVLYAKKRADITTVGYSPFFRDDLQLIIMSRRDMIIYLTGLQVLQESYNFALWRLLLIFFFSFAEARFDNLLSSSYIWFFNEL